MATRKIREAYKLAAPDFDHTSEDMSETLQEYNYQMGRMAGRFKKMTMAKFKKDKTEARLFLILKDEIQDNGRPLSNDAVNASVVDDPDCQELTEAYLLHKINYEESLGIIKQLEVKLDLLRTVEATRRMEMSKNM